jgi:hypothetical protein
MSRLFRAALYGGLVAGTVDIGAACLINGAGPAPILRFIASGLVGRANVLGRGAEILLLGLILQWAMSILIAGIYAFAAERLAVLTRRWIPMGLSYGVVVFIVMTYVVVPLSAAPKSTHASVRALALNFVAMLVFGLIVSGITRSVYARSRL